MSLEGRWSVHIFHWIQMEISLNHQNTEEISLLYKNVKLFS